MSPRKKSHLKSKLVLTLEQELALAGFSSLEDTFASPAHARQTWFTHRERMMQYAGDGQRPLGWWCFEQNEGKPSGSQNETARLAALGELTDAERAELRPRGSVIVPDPGPRLIAETPNDKMWWRRP